MGSFISLVLIELYFSNSSLFSLFYYKSLIRFRSSYFFWKASVSFFYSYWRLSYSIISIYTFFLCSFDLYCLFSISNFFDAHCLILFSTSFTTMAVFYFEYSSLIFLKTSNLSWLFSRSVFKRNLLYLLSKGFISFFRSRWAVRSSLLFNYG